MNAQQIVALARYETEKQAGIGSLMGDIIGSSILGGGIGAGVGGLGSLISGNGFVAGVKPGLAIGSLLGAGTGSLRAYHGEKYTKRLKDLKSTSDRLREEAMSAQDGRAYRKALADWEASRADLNNELGKQIVDAVNENYIPMMVVPSMAAGGIIPLAKKRNEQHEKQAGLGSVLADGITGAALGGGVGGLGSLLTGEGFTAGLVPGMVVGGGVGAGASLLRPHLANRYDKKWNALYDAYKRRMRELGRGGSSMKDMMSAVVDNDAQIKKLDASLLNKAINALDNHIIAGAALPAGLAGAVVPRLSGEEQKQAAITDEQYQKAMDEIDNYAPDEVWVKPRKSTAMKPMMQAGGLAGLLASPLIADAASTGNKAIFRLGGTIGGGVALGALAGALLKRRLRKKQEAIASEMESEGWTKGRDNALYAPGGYTAALSRAPSKYFRTYSEGD